MEASKKIKLLKKAVEVLNKVKGTNFAISNIHVTHSSYGEYIECKCRFPKGYTQELSWSDLWFDIKDDMDMYVSISIGKEATNKIMEADASDDDKVVMLLMT